MKLFDNTNITIRQKYYCGEMTDTDPTTVGFFRCVQPITREVSSQHGYHPEFEKIGEKVSVRKCYMNKFDKRRLESCYEQLRNDIELQGATCDFLSKETFD